jgi:putative transposase
MRYIVAWKLCVTMKAPDVTDTLDLALAKSRLYQGNVGHCPQLLSDNGASYISGNLAEWLDDKKIEQSVARLIIIRHRVRSSVGIKR